MILIIDFGSQYTSLIAKIYRRASISCQIYPMSISIMEIKDINPHGIILSGGPLSVTNDSFNNKIFDLGIPILGICYGMQLIAKYFDGEVITNSASEFGKSIIEILDSYTQNEGYSPIMKNFFIKTKLNVWMSHYDTVSKVPPLFKSYAITNDGSPAIIGCTSKNIYAVQFHPEVSHTERGLDILSNFITICKCPQDWNPIDTIDSKILEIRSQVGNNNVLCAVSGGIDSLVTALILKKAIDNQMKCFFIDTGLMRKYDLDDVKKLNETFKLNITFIDAKDRFLNALLPIYDSESKRRTIGKLFIDIFEKEAKNIENLKFLAQGTLYTDIIESRSTFGESMMIKSHHNVGGLPEHMNLSLIEPLKDLFKNDVRRLAISLNIDKKFRNRYPFPGPGLSIRIPGCITQKYIDILREVDDIVTTELINNCNCQIWQAFAILLPIYAVGVKGDQRSVGLTTVIRCVQSEDGMTADWVELPKELLEKISNKIINNVPQICRVLYDITSKPPGTIEWE